MTKQQQNNVNQYILFFWIFLGIGLGLTCFYINAYQKLNLLYLGIINWSFTIAVFSCVIAAALEFNK